MKTFQVIIILVILLGVDVWYWIGQIYKQGMRVALLTL